MLQGGLPGARTSLAAAGVAHEAHFVDAGHKSSSDGMSKALRACVDKFTAGMLPKL